MTRKEHLVFCKQCLNRQSNAKQGLVCSLTAQIADFEDECLNFSLDQAVVLAPSTAMVQNDANLNAAQRDILFGAIWCIGGTIATIADIGYIFWGAIVFGGIQCVKGIINLEN